MRLNRIALIAVTAAAAMAGLSAPSVAQDRVTESRDLSDFDSIELRGAADLTIRTGEAFAVTIEARDGTLERLDTRVRDGRLVIDLDTAGHWNARRDDLDITIGLPALKDLTVDGAADVDLTAPAANALAITINGAADVAGRGSCDTFAVTINGAGDIDMQALECKSVAVTINGAGDATVYASASVDAAINGVGDIDVYGNPKTVSRSSGMLGSISIHQ